MKSQSPKKLRTSIDSLTPLRIARTALGLIDRDGLEALSIRRLAAELKCEAMSVYHHVPSKGHLLDSVVDLLMEEIELPVPGKQDWVLQLRTIAQSYRKVAERHPKAFILLATRRFNSDQSFQFLETNLEILKLAGFDELMRVRMVRMIGHFINGALLNEMALRHLQLEPTAVVIPDHFRHVQAVAPYLGSTYFDSYFNFALELVLAQVQKAPRTASDQP